MRPIELTKQLATADDDGICQSQTPVGAGSLTLNGALVSGGVAQMDTQRRVSINSGASDESGVTFTVTGTDESGNPISEDIAGPLAGGQVATELDFFTVTDVAVDGATTGAITVGSHSSGSTQPVRLNQRATPFNVSLELAIESDQDVNASVQFTMDPNVNTRTGPFHWFDHGDIHLRTEDTTGSLISPVTAVRLLNNDGDGLATLEIIQAGP